MTDLTKARAEIPKFTDDKIILFNGPPRVGKDTVALVILDILRQAYENYSGHFPERHALAAKLKNQVASIFNLPLSLIYTFEQDKGAPRKEFNGASFRDACIFTAEKIMRPIFGRDIYVHYMLQSMQRSKRYVNLGERPPKYVYIVTDLGFDEELGHIGNYFTKENMLIIRMYSNTRNVSFKTDSRGYVNTTGYNTIDYYNDAILGTADSRAEIDNLYEKIYMFINNMLFTETQDITFIPSSDLQDS